MSENVKHAPGPWRRGIGNDAHKVFDSQGRIVADYCGYDDGHLIAAAPDLLAACKRLANLCADCCPASPSGDEAIAEAVAAIKRAKGQAAA